MKDIDFLRESQEYWENFDHSLAHWKENFQALRVVRKDDVASGELLLLELSGVRSLANLSFAASG